jgi:CheY-like chemotaxis protein
MSAVRRRRISVVNDNADFLELMSAILDEDAGYEVSVFAGEDTSIDQLAASNPDLVIVDLLLGGASGWEIVTLARADERLANLPIIVCSADVNGLRSRASELERVGRVHLLPKPFGIDEMTSLVREVIGEPEVALR